MKNLVSDILSEKDIKILLSFWEPTFKHIVLLLHEKYKKTGKRQDIQAELHHIYTNYQNIIKYLDSYHYEFLFSGSPNTFLLNDILFDDMSYNLELLRKFSPHCDYKNGELYAKNIYNFLWFQQGRDSYYFSVAVYAGDDFRKSNYYGIQDSSWLLSINIIKTQDSEIPKGDIVIDNTDWIRKFGNADIVYTGSILLGKETFTITCLQSIKGHRTINMEKRFYRYILYFVYRFAQIRDIQDIYWFSDATHPCAWEREDFRWDYDNIFSKRGFNLNWKLYHVITKDYREKEQDICLKKQIDEHIDVISSIIFTHA